MSARVGWRATLDRLKEQYSEKIAQEKDSITLGCAPFHALHARTHLGRIKRILLRHQGRLQGTQTYRTTLRGFINYPKELSKNAGVYTRIAFRVLQQVPSDSSIQKKIESRKGWPKVFAASSGIGLQFWPGSWHDPI